MKLQSAIQDALSSLSPSHIDLVNESDMHRGPPNRETHFKLVIVSENFNGKSRVARQQMVYQTLDFAFTQGLHALSLKTYTPLEWDLSEDKFKSPDCIHKK